MRKMKITVVGGGNIGTQFAVHCAYKGHEVTVYTSEPDVFETHLLIVDESGSTSLEGDICEATNDPDKAFNHAELILITFPAHMMKEIADILYDHCNENAVIGVVPGNGGSECAFRELIERGNAFFLL